MEENFDIEKWKAEAVLKIIHHVKSGSRASVVNDIRETVKNILINIRTDILADAAAQAEKSATEVKDLSSDIESL